MFAASPPFQVLRQKKLKPCAASFSHPPHLIHQPTLRGFAFNTCEIQVHLHSPSGSHAGPAIVFSGANRTPSVFLPSPPVPATRPQHNPHHPFQPSSWLRTLQRLSSQLASKTHPVHNPPGPLPSLGSLNVSVHSAPRHPPAPPGRSGQAVLSLPSACPSAHI